MSTEPRGQTTDEFALGLWWIPTRDGWRDARLSECATEIQRLRMVMRECCDAIRDQDDIGALRMLEVALNAR